MSHVARAAVVRMRRNNPDPTIQALVASVVRYVVITVGLIAVLQQWACGQPA